MLQLHVSAVERNCTFFFFFIIPSTRCSKPNNAEVKYCAVYIFRQKGLLTSARRPSGRDGFDKRERKWWLLNASRYVEVLLSTMLELTGVLQFSLHMARTYVHVKIYSYTLWIIRYRTIKFLQYMTIIIIFFCCIWISLRFLISKDS